MKTQLTSKFNWFFGLIFLFPLLSFSQDYKWEWAIEPQFDMVYGFSEGLSTVAKGTDWEARKWGIINNKGEFVVDYRFDKIYSFSEGMAAVKNSSLKDKHYRSGKWGFINKKGQLVIDYKYGSVSNFSDGLSRVELFSENGKWAHGYINKRGEEEFSISYNNAESFSEGLALVYQGYKCIGEYIDPTGKVIFSGNFCRGDKFSDGLAVVYVNPNFSNEYSNDWLAGVIDKYGNFIIKPKFKQIFNFSEGYACIRSNYDIAFSKPGKFGFINKYGSVVIDSIYDYANDFSEGLARVKLDDRYGFINQKGKVVIDLKYIRARNFVNGLVAVKNTNNVWEFIDKSGKVITTTSLDDIGSIAEGLVSAKKNDKWGFVRLLNEYDQVFRYVNLELDKWADKAKYEKINDYQNRVNENTRKTKIKELQKEALSVVGAELFEGKCQNKSFDYDPESEIFKIEMEAIPAIFVHVPIDEALVFDQNFEKINYKNLTWGLDDKQILITNATLANPVNNKSYTYDINTPVTFKKVEVLANFNPIDVEDISTIDKADQQETTEILEYGLSDVDTDIPESASVKDNTFCLIIGNEDYTKYQPNLNTESNVDFAINDAKVFAEYCNKTLGIPKENITLLEDAISSQMKREIMRLANKTKYSKGDVELIFYYSGHGFPDNETKEGYIMPVDIAGANVTDGIKLSKLYQDLTEYPAQKVTVILDACFSGGGRNQGLLAAKGVKVKPKENLVQGNLVVMAASSGDQESLFFKEEQHGLFTYYLLKKLKETKGEVSYKEMIDYLYIHVPSTASDKYYKEQNPNMNVSSDVESEWEEWKFR